MAGIMSFLMTYYLSISWNFCQMQVLVNIAAKEFTLFKEK